MHPRQRSQMFQSYLQQRFAEADAITPGQKLEVIDQLKREARGEVPGYPGVLRLPQEGGGAIMLPTSHELVRAALEGRRVSMGGTTIEAHAPASSLSERVAELPTPAKMSLMLLIGTFPLLVMCGLLTLLNGDAERAPSGQVAAAVEKPTITPTLTLAATITPTLTVEPAVTEVAVITVTVPAPTATPYAIALGMLGGEAGSSGNDPASIEVAGYTWVLAAGEVTNGQWLPVGAEWLAGTQLRRVVAVPYEPDVAQTISALRGGEVIRLRLRSGEIARYQVAEVRRQQRQQIEVLAERSPSLVLLLHSEPSAERWVVVAEAIQQPQAFTVYTAGVPGVSAEAPAPVVPTAAGLAPLAPDTPPGSGEAPTTSAGEASDSPLAPSEIITDTQTIRSEAVGLQLTVRRCQRAERIGDEKPPRPRGGHPQEFLLCDVTLTALEGHVSVPYSADALAITEESWITSNIDWWPPSVAVTRALSSGGTLTPGRSTGGRIAGLVARDGGSFLAREGQPVVVWEAGGQRYLIRVAEAER